MIYTNQWKHRFINCNVKLCWHVAYTDASVSHNNWYLVPISSHQSAVCWSERKKNLIKKKYNKPLTVSTFNKYCETLQILYLSFSGTLKNMVTYAFGEIFKSICTHARNLDHFQSHFVRSERNCFSAIDAHENVSFVKNCAQI